MSESESFITYMKTLREYNQPDAAKTDDQDCYADNIGVDTNLYCFFYKNNHPTDVSLSNSNSKNQCTESTVVKPTTSPVFDKQNTRIDLKLDQPKTPMHTEIITIKLFEQDKPLLNVVNKATLQHKPLAIITEKLKVIFSRLAQSIASFFKNEKH